MGRILLSTPQLWPVLMHNTLPLQQITVQIDTNVVEDDALLCKDIDTVKSKHKLYKYTSVLIVLLCVDMSMSFFSKYSNNIINKKIIKYLHARLYTTLLFKIFNLIKMAVNKVW